MIGAQYMGQLEPASVADFTPPRQGTGGGWMRGPGVPMPQSRYTGGMRSSKRPAGMKRPPWANYTNDESHG